MTVQFDWPAEVVAQLTEEARRRGLTLDTYVLETVAPRNDAWSIHDYAHRDFYN